MYGIIWSVKNQDAKHLALKRTSPHRAEYSMLNQNIIVFDEILQKAIHEAESNLYLNLFQKYKMT